MSSVLGSVTGLWGGSLNSLVPWLMIMVTPALNILLAVLFHGFGEVVTGEYREKRESRIQVYLHSIVVSWIAVAGILLLGLSKRDPVMLILAGLMAICEIAVTVHSARVGEAFLASRTVKLKEQARGYAFDLLCVGALLYFGLRYEQPLWILGALLRFHHGLWSTYHLLFLNVPALSYGYVAGALMLTALFVYPLGPGELSVETMRWFFSTIAQVFAAVLGVVGIFATFTLRRVKGTRRTRLTPTTNILDGITGFTLVNLAVIGLAGASIPYAAGAAADIELSARAMLHPWASGAVVPTLLVVLNTALVLNALGYTALFLWRTYLLGWTEQVETEG